MALFSRRQKKEDILPKEVREYYDSERRERTGLAWVLAIATLVVTFLIAAGLFFGGRWVYRTAFNHDDNKQTASNKDEGLRVDEKGNVIGGSSQQNTSTESGSTNSGANTGTSSTSTNVPSSSTPNTSTSNTTQNTPKATPNTGPAPTELIDTGPGDEL